MALLAGIRLPDGASYERSLLHVTYDAKRTRDRRWRLEYHVTRRLERPCSLDDRTLRNEWQKLPATVASLKDAQATEPGLITQEWLGRPEIEAQWRVYVAQRRTESEHYYAPLPQLDGFVVVDQGDGHAAACYEALKARPEIIDPQDA